MGKPQHVTADLGTRQGTLVWENPVNDWWSLKCVLYDFVYVTFNYLVTFQFFKTVVDFSRSLYLGDFK